MKRMSRLVLVGLAGAAAQFFLDPHNGKRRRHEARDRGGAFFRRRSRELGQKARYAQGVAEGVPHRVAATASGKQAAEFDDVTLANKVESEIFRAPDAPKGKVDVNAENGVVYLRGQLERAEQIDDLVQAAEKVGGVKEVKSLLHLPDTPAPTKDGRTRETASATSE
jgi:hypothetical protein